jgi:hypothetical protein
VVFQIFASAKIQTLGVNFITKIFILKKLIFMYKEKIIISTNVLLYKHHDDLSYAKTEGVSMTVVKEKS